MLLSPRKQPRAVSKVPYKVLDAPELADDFYLNLVDWGSTNILGVGLGSSVYMWNSNTGKVTKLCDLGTEDSVTSVSWIQRVCATHASVSP
jgi:cell division cycle 20-like protein 1 (cofactor of APC complex)